jgi:hypothetical protein
MLFAIVSVFVANAAPALAVRPSLPARAGAYTCEPHGLSRVALAPEPPPCCAGLFGCPQLLSNTGLIKPKHTNRT